MSREIVRRRVRVTRGIWKGCRGWGYFTEDQDQWDSLSVRLDRAVSRSTRYSMARVWRSDIGDSEGDLVRLNRTEIEILSDLEALAEVAEDSEVINTNGVLK